MQTPNILASVSTIYIFLFLFFSLLLAWIDGGLNILSSVIRVQERTLKWGARLNPGESVSQVL